MRRKGKESVPDMNGEAEIFAKEKPREVRAEEEKALNDE